MANAVQEAAATRDVLLAQVEVLKGAEAKLAALADKYDAIAYDMAREAVEEAVAQLEEPRMQ